MQEKQCKVCGETKTLDLFYVEKKGLYGRRNLCIPCFNNRRKDLYHLVTKEKELAKNKEWSQKYPDKRNTYTAKWRKANKPHKAALERIRKTQRKEATPKWLTPEQKKKILWYYQIADLLRKQGIDCQVDHVIPLMGKDVCGLHVPWNLMVITKEENTRKGNRLLTS